MVDHPADPEDWPLCPGLTRKQVEGCRTEPIPLRSCPAADKFRDTTEESIGDGVIDCIDRSSIHRLV
jgi:hypothetical protein